MPLAAAAFTHGVFGVFYVVGLGLLLGTGVFAARDHGAGDETGCAAWLRHGRALALAVGIGGFALMALLATQLHHFGQPPEVIAMVVAGVFLLIAGSMVLAILFKVQRKFSESLGRPWVPLGIMLADVAWNAFLNWVFVFGHLGFSSMGLSWLRVERDLPGALVLRGGHRNLAAVFVHIFSGSLGALDRVGTGALYSTAPAGCAGGRHAVV